MTPTSTDSTESGSSARSFQAHLGTNYAPTTNEIAQIKAFIVSDQTKCDKLANQVSELQQQIARLLKQQRPVLQRIDDHKALLHPIRRLPAEILQEIFISCLPTDLPGSMHVEDCPMVFTLVCKAWRETALQTPRLWSTMYIPLPTFSKDPQRLSSVRASGIQQWLTRSKSVPLSLTIVQISDGRYSAETSIFDNILHVLRPHADRWESLHLAISWECMSGILDQPDIRYPVLKTVTLRISSPRWPQEGAGEPESATELLSAGFLQSPVLTGLVLNCLPENIAFTDMQVSWERLTTLSVDVDTALIAPMALFSILRQTQHLEDLRLSISVDQDANLAPNPDNGTIITLPKLKHLSVLEYAPFPFFGKAVRCPALEYLEYYDAYPDWNPHDAQAISDMEQSALACFLTHSGGQLRTLMFDPALYTTPFVIHFLRHCKQLQSLALVRVYNRYTSRNSIWTVINDEFLQAFITPDPESAIPDETICPLLMTLAFDSPVGFSPEELKAFLKTKQNGSTAKLKRLVVNFPEVETGEDYIGEVMGLFPNGGHIAIRLPSKPVPFTLRDGMWECAPFNKWHSFSFQKYFNVMNN